MRAVVSGAGIAGLSHALALTRLGWEVTVVEVAPGPRRGGYMIDFFGPGWAAAEELGVLEALRAGGRVYRSARYVDARGRQTGQLGLDTFLRTTGGRYFSILRPEIEEVLREALPPEVVLRHGRVITRIDQEPGAGAPVRVGLDDGTVLAADLVLGADGLHSGVRRLVLGEEGSFLRPLGYHTAAFTCTAPHLAERLGEDVHLTDVRDGQVGVFAVDLGRPDERPGGAGVVSAFVVTRGGVDLPSDPQAAVRRELVRHGPVAAELVDRVPPDVYLDVVAQSVVPRWRRGRVVVVGDAAHAVSLLAGQGASLAIAGATALAGQLGGGRDLDEALTAYETSWRSVVEPVQATGRRAASAFVPRTRRDQWLRRLVLRAARLPWVDRRLTASITGAATH